MVENERNQFQRTLREKQYDNRNQQADLKNQIRALNQEQVKFDL